MSLPKTTINLPYLTQSQELFLESHPDRDSIRQDISRDQYMLAERHGNFIRELILTEFNIILDEVARRRYIEGYIEDPDDTKQMQDILNSFIEARYAELQGECGLIYMIRLVPENRFKVGFTTNLASRLKAYKTSCPEAKVFATWPGSMRWERLTLALLKQSKIAVWKGGEVFHIKDELAVKSILDDWFDALSQRDKANTECDRIMQNATSVTK